MILYHYAQAVKEAAKNPTYRQYMVNALTVNNEAKTASLLTLAQGDASFANFLNSELRQSISEKTVYPRGVEANIETLMTSTTWDANTYLTGKIVYAPYAYDPVIYYMKKPNAASANNAATVVISQDVNDCDDVAGWRGDTELLVGETEATTSEDLILFVGPGNPVQIGGGQLPNYSGEEYNLPESGIQERAPSTYINITEYQIKNGHRYESSGKSEVRGWLVRYDEFVPPTFVVKNMDIFDRKVKKCDIKESIKFTFPNDGQAMFFVNPTQGWVENNAFFGFYERDWYVAEWNEKYISNPCYSGPGATNGVSITLKMKYAHEWYYKDFCGLGSAILPNDGDTKVGSNEKCSFKILRKD